MLGCVCPAQRITQVCSHVYVFDASSVKVPTSGINRKNKERKIIDTKKKRQKRFVHFLLALVHDARVFYLFKEAIAQAYKLLKLGHVFDLLFYLIANGSLLTSLISLAYN